MEAMPILERTNNPKYKWSIYNAIALNYLNQLDNKTAFDYFKKALNLKVDSIRKFATLNNMAIVYTEEKNIKQALKIYKYLLLKKEIIKDKHQYSRIISNIGYCYFQLGHPKSIDFLLKSLEIRLKTKDISGLVDTYYNLSKFYEKSNLQLAKVYAQSSFTNSTKINNVESKIATLKILVKITDGLESKKYSMQYIALTDSLIRARQIAKNQFAKIRYDSTKEKDENLILKTERAEKDLLLERQKNSNLILSAILIIGLLTFLVIFYIIKQKNKKEKIQTSYSTETRISKQLHDELANDLFRTMPFAQIHDLSTTNNKEILLDKLDLIYSRTRDISKENSHINTEAYYIPNLKEMITDFNTESVNIIVNGLDSINWSKIQEIKKIILYRVIQELLVNMTKHSYSSLVLLSFKKENNSMCVNYTDNGIGSYNSERTNQSGLQNMQNRIHSIKGKITLDTNIGKGYKVNIQIPI
jgi:signal transduction histidine kinase